MTHIAVRNTYMRKDRFVEQLEDFQVGDVADTLVAMNVRAEIEYKSDIIGSMPEGCQFIIFETGDPFRCLISSGNVTGWISSRTNMGQPLIKKVKPGTGVLPVYECEVQMNLREDMEFKSSVLAVLPAGTQFDLIEEGPQNRIKIFVHDEDGDAHIGWITSKTDLGQPLIKSLSAEESTRMSKNLDTYIAKQLSKAEINRVVSYVGERPVSNVKSTKSNAAEGDHQKAASPASKEKAPPPLSKLACCCSA